MRAIPNNLRSDYYNPVIDASDTPDSMSSTCRLFNSNALPIAGIMLSRESEVMGGVIG